MQHPYLFVSGADAARFRKKIHTDPAAKERYQNATAKCEEYLAEPFVTWEEANGSNTLHANFGRINWQANRFCDSLGLRYLIGGDERCAAKLKAYISENYYTCTDEILFGLGQMYVSDPRFKENIDAAGGEGTAEFVSKAIAHFCGK